MDKNSLPKKIKVGAYSGYKANERPLYLIVDDMRLEVQKVIDRWYGEEHDYFQVLANDGNVYRISRHRTGDIWSLERILKRKGGEVKSLFL
ncbi:MAG: hypothetical protein JRC68_03785 [Deltaproteobacteria bacterium]|nr:hypothetical protein [Deltaproteobacteria bacterium]